MTSRERLHAGGFNASEFKARMREAGFKAFRRVGSESSKFSKGLRLDTYVLRFGPGFKNKRRAVIEASRIALSSGAIRVSDVSDTSKLGQGRGAAMISILHRG